jgi:hypothetical protein
MAQATYCKACFMLISAENTSEDAAAYAQFLDTVDAARLLKQGHCSRCGQLAQVIYNDRKKVPNDADA